MPLTKGAAWTYQAEPGLLNETVDIKVGDKTPVGEVEGVVLTSPWGDSKLAWQGDKLLAAQLGGTRYRPPIPLVANLAKGMTIPWKGEVSVAGKTSQATAVLETKDTKARIGSRELPSTESTLTLQITDGKQAVTHEILTWFVSGYGVARQEQRKDGRLINRLTYLSGP